MTKHATAAAGLRRDPGEWAAGQQAKGATWAEVAQQLYVLTGVAVSAKTVKQWAGRPR